MPPASTQLAMRHCTVVHRRRGSLHRLSSLRDCFRGHIIRVLINATQKVCSLHALLADMLQGNTGANPPQLAQGSSLLHTGRSATPLLAGIHTFWQWEEEFAFEAAQPSEYWDIMPMTMRRPPCASARVHVVNMSPPTLSHIKSMPCAKRLHFSEGWT